MHRTTEGGKNKIYNCDKQQKKKKFERMQEKNVKIMKKFRQQFQTIAKYIANGISKLQKLNLVFYSNNKQIYTTNFVCEISMSTNMTKFLFMVDRKFAAAAKVNAKIRIQFQSNPNSDQIKK